MTIETLLDMPAASVAAMSDADLTRWLAPYFPLTRPRTLAGLEESMDLDNFPPEVAEALAKLEAEAKAKSPFAAMLKKPTP